ncbi:MAG: DUF2794 domain-containing protein [Rhodospirillaceae bacterium]
MSTIVRLADFRPAALDTCFSRRELEQLLAVYSRRVISGEWKDYGIRHEPRMAAFLIYRNSSQQPAFSVIKREAANGKTEFLVYHGRERLRRSHSLTDAISVLKRKFRLVN